MINGIGVVGWGVGGIEAEAGMLGQPVYFLTPDVVGVHLKGELREGVTATDLVLTVTEMLRKAKVVGKFVEFFGEGTASLAVPDRATIGNMAPEYGATMGFFPVDEKTIDYFKGTGRTDAGDRRVRDLLQGAELFGIPTAGEIDYTQTLDARPRHGRAVARRSEAPAGPHRARQCEASTLQATLFSKPDARERLQTQAGRTSCDAQGRQPADATASPRRRHRNGDVLIAAITSCTNTSNPSVLLAAGLLAKKAVEKGLTVAPHIKTSLAPGSRVVTEYLTQDRPAAVSRQARLRRRRLRLHDLHRQRGRPDAGNRTKRSSKNDLVCAAVLSGNRNFEARIHPNIKANFLASPPLVVAYAIAGKVRIDLMTEPVGKGKRRQRRLPAATSGRRARNRARCSSFATDPATFRKLYGDRQRRTPLWSTDRGDDGPGLRLADVDVHRGAAVLRRTSR